jgi:tetratricopeptide (TPR) repeat protein
MRRIWERQGKIFADRRTAKKASLTAVSEAEAEHARNPERRGAVADLFTLYALSDQLDRATQLATTWSAKDPLDPQALTARADLAARRGERDSAIRILGSVIDVRPDDVASQKRLARLYRWAGRAELGCRFSMAIAQVRQADAKLLTDAVRCGRESGLSEMSEVLLAAADDKTRKQAEALLEKAAPDDKLSGDLRVEATWQGGVDLDLAFIHPDGHRVSWLGAPTRSVITATDVTDLAREGLALRGAKPGEYLVEIARGDGSAGTIRGTLTLTVAGTKKAVPFELVGERVTVAVADVSMKSRLVPVRGGGGRW